MPPIVKASPGKQFPTERHHATHQKIQYRGVKVEPIIPEPSKP